MILPSEKVLPARLNMELIKRMQDNNPNVFTPPAVYDGRKNMFASHTLPFAGGADSQEVCTFNYIVPDASDIDPVQR